jgi:hypothetical protein
VSRFPGGDGDGTLGGMMRASLVSLLVVALAGCNQLVTACPAIGYSSALVVRLADDWPPGDARTVTLDCPEEEVCGLPSAFPREAVPSAAVVPFQEPAPPPAGQSPAPEVDRESPVVQPLSDGSAEFVLFSSPETVTLTVTEAGEDVVSVTVRPEWVRVGGSEECGGPLEAELVVPAP